MWWHQGDRDVGTQDLGPSRADGNTKGKCSGLRGGDRDTVLRTKLRLCSGLGWGHGDAVLGAKPGSQGDTGQCSGL